MRISLIAALALASGTALPAQSIYVWTSSNPDPIAGDDGAIVEIRGGQETFLASTGSTFNGPVGLAVDGNGFLYSGNPSNSTVTQYASGGVSTPVGGSDSISGLAFYQGQLYGTSPNYNAILGPPNLQAGTAPDAKLDFPANIAFSSQGNLFTANVGQAYAGLSDGPSANTIEEFSPTLDDLKTFASNLDEPYGLAFSPAGNLLVSNLGNNTIDLFTPSGVEHVFATAAQGLDEPAGLAFDSQGNLYVANEGNGTVEELFPDGYHATIASGLAEPVSIAISDLPLAAAPEPESWLLGGLAAIVFASINPAYLAKRRRSPC